MCLTVLTRNFVLENLNVRTHPKWIKRDQRCGSGACVPEIYFIPIHGDLRLFFPCLLSLVDVKAILFTPFTYRLLYE